VQTEFCLSTELDDWMTVHVCRHAHHADGSWHTCSCTALTLAHIHAQASEEVLINLVLRSVSEPLQQALLECDSLQFNDLTSDVSMQTNAPSQYPQLPARACCSGR
jgi:hypothetical protein